MIASYATVDALAERLGEEAGTSAWLRVERDRVDAFAEVTGDRQWIHVDPVRAATESPYGTTIAHGFLSVALLARFLDEAIVVRSARMSVNYGFDRLRFLAPVVVGAEIRARFVLGALVRTGAVARVSWDVTIEIRDSAKPALAAVWITQLYE